MKEVLGAIVRVTLNKDYLKKEFIETRCLEMTKYKVTGGLKGTTMFKVDARTYEGNRCENVLESFSTFEISVTLDEVRLFIQKDFSLFDSYYFKIQALNDVVGRYLKSAPAAEQ